MCVLVTAANVPEREGGKQVLGRLQQLGEQVSRLYLVWVDGGYSGEPFLRFVMPSGGPLQMVLRPQESKGFILLKKRWVVERTCMLVELVSTLNSRLRVFASKLRDHDLHRHDSSNGSAFSIIGYTPMPFQTAS